MRPARFWRGARGTAPSDPDGLFEVLREHCLCPERIVLETGTMSGWLARELVKVGMPVEVIDARQAHAVMKLQHNKTDAGDAELLAEIARTGFCRRDSVASEAAQEARILLKAQSLGEGWFSRAIESGIEPLVAFAKRLKSYLPGILAHCRRPLHTSPLEGINNKIKVIKRLASGTTTTSSSKSEPLSLEFGDEP